MYYYIIDPQKINQKTFERVQNQLYSCLSEHRISGEITRVTSLRNISQLVETAFLRGATTIVAVGHDSTVQEIINAVGDREVALGYVPLAESELAKILGVGDVISACKTLAQRRIENLDLGKIQNHYFFTKIGLGINLDIFQNISLFNLSQYAALKPVVMKFNIDDQYDVEFQVAVGGVYNSRAAHSSKGIANPTDGMLDILMVPALTPYQIWRYKNELASGELELIPGCAVVHGKKINFIAPSNLPFYLGEKILTKSPGTFDVSPWKVKIIVGRDRLF